MESIVIIGGGIIGSSTAYHLAMAGLSDQVTVLEPDPTYEFAATPKSSGGAYWSTEQGGANKDHKGDPSCDTGDFSDRSVGNMRIDYVLPSRGVEILDGGVYWPSPDDDPDGNARALLASDHRLVWLDLRLPAGE